MNSSYEQIVPLWRLGMIQVGDQFSVLPTPGPFHGTHYIQVETDRLTSVAFPRGSKFGYIGDTGWPTGTLFEIIGLNIDRDSAKVRIVDSAMTLPDGF